MPETVEEAMDTLADLGYLAPRQGVDLMSDREMKASDDA